jgi:hypothetical protein
MQFGSFYFAYLAPLQLASASTTLLHLTDFYPILLCRPQIFPLSSPVTVFNIVEGIILWKRYVEMEGIMKKICNCCGLERDAEQDFNWKDKQRGVRQTRCKACQSLVSKQHYENNKQVYMERSHARDAIVIADNQRELATYLGCHPCVDCGNNDIRVLEFDHVRGTKSGNISMMAKESRSWATIEAEIAKCEVRCANCHRIKTSERGSFWRSFFNL